MSKLNRTMFEFLKSSHVGLKYLLNRLINLCEIWKNNYRNYGFFLLMNLIIKSRIDC